MKVKCIKSLYKSTYKRSAFLKNKKYEIVSEEEVLIFVKDELGREFSFSKSQEDKTSYYIFDYFQHFEFKYVKNSMFFF